VHARCHLKALKCFWRCSGVNFPLVGKVETDALHGFTHSLTTPDAHRQHIGIGVKTGLRPVNTMKIKGKTEHYILAALLANTPAARCQWRTTTQPSWFGHIKFMCAKEAPAIRSDQLKRTRQSSSSSTSLRTKDCRLFVDAAVRGPLNRSVPS